MTKTANTNTMQENYAELVRFVTANGVIVVHPNDNIIKKIAQKLQKTK